MTTRKHTSRNVAVLIFICALSVGVEISYARGRDPNQARALSNVTGFVQTHSPYNATENRILILSLTSAQEKDLPLDRVINKVKEGIAKGVNPHRLISVTNAEIERLSISKNMVEASGIGGLKGEKKNALVAYIADLLLWKMPRSYVEELVGLVKDKNLNIDYFHRASALFVDLVAKDVPDDSAKDLSLLAVEKKLRKEEAEAILRLFVTAKKNRVTVDEAEDIIVKGLKAGRSLRVIRNALLDAGRLRKMEER